MAAFLAPVLGGLAAGAGGSLISGLFGGSGSSSSSSSSRSQPGDAYAQLGQIDAAFNYYVEASKTNDNMYSTPKYLYKAAMLGAENGKVSQAISFLDRIEKEFPKSEEAQWVAVQKGKLEHLNP